MENLIWLVDNAIDRRSNMTFKNIRESFTESKRRHDKLYNSRSEDSIVVSKRMESFPQVQNMKHKIKKKKIKQKHKKTNKRDANAFENVEGTQSSPTCRYSSGREKSTHLEMKHSELKYSSASKGQEYDSDELKRTHTPSNSY